MQSGWLSAIMVIIAILTLLFGSGFGVLILRAARSLGRSEERQTHLIGRLDTLTSTVQRSIESTDRHREKMAEQLGDHDTRLAVLEQPYRWRKQAQADGG